MPVGRELHDVIKVNPLSSCSDYSFKGAGVTAAGGGCRQTSGAARGGRRGRRRSGSKRRISALVSLPPSPPPHKRRPRQKSEHRRRLPSFLLLLSARRRDGRLNCGQQGAGGRAPPGRGREAGQILPVFPPGVLRVSQRAGKERQGGRAQSTAILGPRGDLPRRYLHTALGLLIRALSAPASLC